MCCVHHSLLCRQVRVTGRVLDISLPPPHQIWLFILIALTRAALGKCASQTLSPNRLPRLPLVCWTPEKVREGEMNLRKRWFASEPQPQITPHPTTPLAAYPAAPESADWALLPAVPRAGCMILGLSFHICKWGSYLPGRHLGHAHHIPGILGRIL